MPNPTHAPRNRFGQNFLHDHSVITNILSSLQTKPGEHWVEIGPGQGALTTPLLDKNITLDVVELDRNLVSLLRNKFKGQPQLTIHSADALKFDFSALIEQGGRKKNYASSATYLTTFLRLCYFIYWRMPLSLQTCTLCCKKKWLTGFAQRQGVKNTVGLV